MKTVDIDKQTGVIDVQVLDLLAQVECLLRNARELQRHLLRVRGVPQPQNAAHRRAAVSRIGRLVVEMKADGATLCTILSELQAETKVLETATR